MTAHAIAPAPDPGDPAAESGGPPVVPDPAWSDRRRLRSLPIPVTEPRPADRIDYPAAWPPVPATQGTLALAVPVPLCTEDDETADDAGTTAPGDLPDPVVWTTQFLQAALEVATGLRSPAQLLRWTTDDVFRLLVRRHGLAARARRDAPAVRRPVVRTVRVCRPRDGVVEASAVVSVEPGRAQAVALRIEGAAGRWQVSVFMIG